MAENEGNAVDRLTYLLIGAGIGAAVALLFAPKAGRELRGDIADVTRKGIDYSKDGARYVGDRATDVYQQTSQKATELYAATAQKAQDLIETHATDGRVGPVELKQVIAIGPSTGMRLDDCRNAGAGISNTGMSCWNPWRAAKANSGQLGPTLSSRSANTHPSSGSSPAMRAAQQLSAVCESSTAATM